MSNTFPILVATSYFACFCVSCGCLGIGPEMSVLCISMNKVLEYGHYMDKISPVLQAVKQCQGMFKPRNKDYNNGVKLSFVRLLLSGYTTRAIRLIFETDEERGALFCPETF